MFSVFTNAWKVKDIRRKMMYVILVLAVYRLGSYIPLPGIDPVLLQAASSSMNTNTLVSAIIGGNIGSLFAMGIGPYITASIIMQLLTVAIPRLEQLKKEGEEGHKKINQYTRVLAVVLATVQGAGTVYSLRMLFYHQNWLVWIMATIALVAGTIYIMWLAELLTEKAIGNGSSFIIFANILAGLPSGIANLYNTIAIGEIMSYVKVILLLLIFLIVIVFVVFVQSGERRIPVQHSKKAVGRSTYTGGQSSYIPIKVNIAGVMAIIFAISLLQFPVQISQFWSPPWMATAVKYLDINHYVGAALYVILIFCFTFFYTSFAINPVEMAENMKKSGGFIPGIRPGKSTSEYIQRTIDRLSWVGAFFYSLIALLPVLFSWIFGIQVGFGGTTLLIVTGVCLDIIKQLESQLLMRHYKGFLK